MDLDSIIESVIDVTRNTLDPRVFEKIGDKYVLKPDIASFISDVVSGINNEIVKVNDYFIKGSILSFQWLDMSDVDLLIEVDEMGENDRRRMQEMVDEKYGDVKIPGTEHPLQIYINAGYYDCNRADGIYRLDSGWVKGPYNISVNLDQYMSKFRKMAQSVDTHTGELKRDLIDYEILKSLPKEEIEELERMLESKLDEINKDVEDIVFQYKHIRDMRHQAFREDMTPKEIVEYGTHNALPENVIFKLMERYTYLEFMRNLKSLMDDDQIDDSEVDEINKIVRGES